MSNQILELTRLFENPDALSADLTDAMNSIRESLQKNYLRRLHAAANEQKTQTREHPPREVTLLRALKQFAGDNASAMDQVIDTLLFLTAFQNMQTELKAVKHRPRYTMRANEEGEAAPAADATDLTGLLLTLAFFEKL